eukprot:c2499_g1_i1 orf=272-1567(+)
MATQNFFELLGDEETDASAVIERAVAMEKVKKKQQQQQEETQALQKQDPLKLPSKPLPPAQAVRESRAAQHESGRGRGGQGRGRGGYGNRDRDYNGGFNHPPQERGFQGNRNFDRGDGFNHQERGFQGNRNIDGSDGFNHPPQERGFQGNRNSDRVDGYRREGNGFQGNRGRFYSQGRAAPFPAEDGEGGQNFEGGIGGGRFRGSGRRQGRGFGDSADSYGAAEGHQKRAYVKKDAAGGEQETEEVKPEGGDVVVPEEETQNVDDKQPVEEPKADIGAAVKKQEEEEEDKEMLLEDYYKALDEKTKHLKIQRTEARKVVADKDFAKMVMVEKKHEEVDFVKLGSEKDKGKKKEVVTDKPRKNVSINEFLKPAEGEEHYYMPAGRRGRGRGGRGRGLGEGYRGGFGGSYSTGQQSSAPRIEDPGQFPTLGAK